MTAIIGRKVVMHIATEAVGKTCTTCRCDRPIERFPHSRFTADGRVDHCISAAAQQGRIVREMRRAGPAQGPQRRSAQVSHATESHRREAR